MSDIAAVASPLLWVGLTFWLVSRYHQQITGLLNAIQARIDRGGAVKAGPFELGEIQPQNIQEQNARLEQEVAPAESSPLNHMTSEQSTIPDDGEKTSLSKQRYLLAEDLVMRELQFEFGAVINRAVKFKGVSFDGVFAKHGKGYGIEVRYLGGGNYPLERVNLSLDKMSRGLDRFGWKNFTVIIVFVLEGRTRLADSFIEQIKREALEKGVQVEVRSYIIQLLAQKFGVDLGAKETCSQPHAD